MEVRFNLDNCIFNRNGDWAAFLYTDYRRYSSAKLHMKKLSKDKERLFSNVSSLTILQIFTYILPLITLPYLVSVLGIEVFGQVVFAQALMVYFSLIVDFGFGFSATREIAINRDNQEKIGEIYGSVICIKLILTVVSFFIFAIIVFSFDKFSQEWELYYLTFLSVVAQAIFPVWFFQGMEKMKYITIINILSRVLFTVLIFVVINNEADYLYVPVLNSLGMFVGGLASILIVRNKFRQKIKLYSYEILKKYFLDSKQFFVSRIAVSIYTSSNIFILGLFTNNTIVGYYSIADKLYQAMQQVYQPLASALYPYMSKEKNIKFFKKIFYSVTTLNILAITIVFFFSQHILDILFTSSITDETLKIFHILLFSCIIVVPSIMIGYPFLSALGYSNYANNSVIYASIFHLLGLGILMIFNSVDAYSVAYLVILTQSLDLGYRLYAINKYKLWVKKAPCVEF